MMAETLRRFGPHSVMGIFSEPFDPDRMTQAGADPENILMFPIFEVDEETGEVRIKTGMAEEAMEAGLHLCKRKDLKLLVVDSAAAMMPKLEMYDGKDLRDLSSNPPAARAKVNNAFVSKFKNLAEEAVLVFVNHYREPINIDLYSAVKMDNSKIQTPCGRGMEFASDVRMLCNSTIEMEKEAHSITGTRQGKQYNTTWTLIKNKYCNTVAHRSVKGSFDTETGRFNNEENLINYADFFALKEKEKIYSKIDPIVFKNGAWITIGDQKFNGIPKAVEYIKNNPELFDKIAKQMYPLHNQWFKDRKPSLEELLESN
jgi:RecA/RadA recombinase